MHSTFVYSLKLSVLRGAGGKALATDHRADMTFASQPQTQTRETHGKQSTSPTRSKYVNLYQTMELQSIPVLPV